MTGAGRRRDPREALATALLLAPALLVILLVLVAPTAWFFWLSAFDADGRPTIENYARIVTARAQWSTFVTTFALSGATVAICILLGVPFAFAMAVSRRRLAALLLLCTLVPFWTALLVRTYTWQVVLQRRGLVNTALVDLGLVDEPLRLINNFGGVLVGMVHIMLPVFILPVYAAMRAVDETYVRAAFSMGASAPRVFREVAVPLCRSGILAGAVLVFVMSLGFYVTPAILGGGNLSVVSMRIERNIAAFDNWGAASALGVVLLAVVLAALGLSRLVLARAEPRGAAGRRPA